MVQIDLHQKKAAQQFSCRGRIELLVGQQSGTSLCGCVKNDLPREWVRLTIVSDFTPQEGGLEARARASIVVETFSRGHRWRRARTRNGTDSGQCRAQQPPLAVGGREQGFETAL